MMGEAKRRRESQQAARAAAAHDFKRVFDHVSKERQNGIMDQVLVDFDTDTSEYGDGDGTMINIAVGFRGELTAAKAKYFADYWRKAAIKHPKAWFCPTIYGYDDDPRELWEFEEVREYVRQWAQFAGIHRPEDIKVKSYLNFMVGWLASMG